MLTLRNSAQRYCCHLHCYLISSFCTTSNNNNPHPSNGQKHHNWLEAPTLPCFLSQFDAMETFNIWAKRQWFAPHKFRRDTEKYVHVIHKYYVPYWHFDATAQSTYHASTSSNKPAIREASTSCSYSSSQPEMQYIASDRLTCDEAKFLSIPLGPTQFQRMTHHVDDLLPDTLNEDTATQQIRSWLQSTETQRVYDYVTLGERLHKPTIKCNVDLHCRKAYMPAFIIYFNPFIPNAKDKPDAINDVIPTEASYRCIVHGYSGNIQGPKIYSYLPCLKVTLPLSAISVLPIGTALLFPIINVSILSLTSGLTLALIMQSPIFTSKLKLLHGHTLDTQQTRLKRQQMEEKEVEDILREAEKSWGFHTHRSRPIAREQQRTAQDTYERYEQETYSQKVSGIGYDSEGRPIGRRAIRFIELYEMLGIAPNASSREIQQAFTKLAKQYHPDQLQQHTQYEKQRGTDKFQKVLLAFQVLKDPDRRKKYDMTGSYKEEKKRNKRSGNDSDKK